MVIRLRARTALLAALLAVAGSVAAGPSPASATPLGQWKVDCTYTRSAPDDPIVKPGLPGASHLHDFFGNVGLNAFSTYASLKNVTSTCADQDRSAYWVPSVYRNGVKAPVSSMIVYYENRYTPETKVEPFPPGFQLVFGNSTATTSAQEDSHIVWGCSDNTQIGGHVPPASCSTGIIQLRTQWPTCWDGKTTNGVATGHVVYHDKNYSCSGAYPHALPGIRMDTYFKVGTTTGTITLASGSIYSAHADFFNAWNEAELNRLVQTCLNQHTDCGHLKGTSPGQDPAPAPTVTAPPASATTGTTGTARSTTAASTTASPTTTVPSRAATTTPQPVEPSTSTTPTSPSAAVGGTHYHRPPQHQTTSSRLHSSLTTYDTPSQSWPLWALTLLGCGLGVGSLFWLAHGLRPRTPSGRRRHAD